MSNTFDAPCRGNIFARSIESSRLGCRALRRSSCHQPISSKRRSLPLLSTRLRGTSTFQTSDVSTNTTFYLHSDSDIAVAVLSIELGHSHENRIKSIQPPSKLLVQLRLIPALRNPREKVGTRRTGSQGDLNDISDGTTVVCT